MATKENIRGGRRFVIHLTGIETGTPREDLASGLQHLFRKKTLGEALDLLDKLPLLLASSASEIQARKVHAFLKPKGAILKITAVTPIRTSATKPADEKALAPDADHAPLDRGVLGRGTPPGEERRAKPRVHPGIQIYPSSLGALLDRAFRLFRQDFRLFFMIVFIPQGLFFLIASGLGLAIGTSGTHEGLGFGVFNIFIVLAFAMVHFWAQGALIFALSEKHLGHRTSIKGSFDAIRKRLAQFLGTLIFCGGMIVIWPALAGMLSAVLLPVLAAVGIRSAVPIVLSVIALIVTIGLAADLFLNWLLVDKVVVLENLGWMSALRRSKELMKAPASRGFWRSNKSKGAAIVLAAVLIVVGIHFLFEAPSALFGFRGISGLLILALMGLAKAILTSVVTTYTLMAMILYYYDIRVRKEGFDLKMMAQNL